MRDTGTNCSHPGCHCTLDTCYIALGGRAYCSAECADAEGCDHEDCRCVEARPASRVGRIVQSAQRHLPRA